jgi:outer membrane protein, adhesin transport system
MGGIRSLSVAAAATLVVVSVAVAKDAFTIVDAINQAAATHPGVGEVAANRRATEAEMRQTQGTLLPQVRLEGRVGRHRFDQQDVVPPPKGNNTWLNTHERSIVVRQLLFDGFTTINEIWRRAARVDAAAYRVRERTELVALDAAEAYIDVVRYTHLVSLANENIAAHRRILSNVEARFEGGRAGEGDLEQVRERVEAAIAVRAQFLQQLDEARAVYRRTVGIEPHNLRIPGRLRGLPASKDASLAITLRHNPTIQAGEADKNAARHGFNATAGSFMPNVAFEGRASKGTNLGSVFGDQKDASALVVATWDIFNGGQHSWRRAEFAERYQEQTMRHARLQREAFELIDKAWAARTITSERIAALIRQIAADRRVIDAYTKEYELGQRSLIDLLNAYNQLFNARVSLETTKGIAVFADYQLLAAMGQLVAYLRAPTTVDAEPLQTQPLGIFPMKLPPILVTLPEPGSEPLNISGAGAVGAGGDALRAYAALPSVGLPQEGSFQMRWPMEQGPSWLEAIFRHRTASAAGQARPELRPSPAGPLGSAPTTQSGLSAWAFDLKSVAMPFFFSPNGPAAPATVPQTSAAARPAGGGRE